MLIKAQKIITKISDNETINTQNYMESLSYISNLYIFLNNIKNVVSTKDITFLPSFKGKYTCEKYGIISNEKENELKIIKVSSDAFLEDLTVNRVRSQMGDLCESINISKNIITFILN